MKGVHLLDLLLNITVEITIEHEIEYCQKLIEMVEKNEGFRVSPKVKNKMNLIKEIPEDMVEQLQMFNAKMHVLGI